MALHAVEITFSGGFHVLRAPNPVLVPDRNRDFVS